jgi:hypothetical protein
MDFIVQQFDVDLPLHTRHGAFTVFMNTKTKGRARVAPLDAASADAMHIETPMVGQTCPAVGQTCSTVAETCPAVGQTCSTVTQTCYSLRLTCARALGVPTLHADAHERRGYVEARPESDYFMPRDPTTETYVFIEDHSTVPVSASSAWSFHFEHAPTTVEMCKTRVNAVVLVAC